MLPPAILAALVIVPVELTSPAVNILPWIALPTLDIKPVVRILPPVMLAVAVT